MNRTILECKGYYIKSTIFSILDLNRTILECKDHYKKQNGKQVNIWIEPYWNVKSVTFASYLPSCHLNRTILECKGNCLSVSSISNFNLNRTILECKADKYPDTIEGVIIWIEPYWNVKDDLELNSINLDIDLNRTILECKKG